MVITMAFGRVIMMIITATITVGQPSLPVGSHAGSHGLTVSRFSCRAVSRFLCFAARPKSYAEAYSVCRLWRTFWGGATGQLSNFPVSETRES